MNRGPAECKLTVSLSACATLVSRSASLWPVELSPPVAANAAWRLALLSAAAAAVVCSPATRRSAVSPAASLTRGATEGWSLGSGAVPNGGSSVAGGGDTAEEAPGAERPRCYALILYAHVHEGPMLGGRPEDARGSSVGQGQPS